MAASSTQHAEEHSSGLRHQIEAETSAEMMNDPPRHNENRQCQAGEDIMHYLSLKKCDEPLGQFLDGIATQPVGVPYGMQRPDSSHRGQTKRKRLAYVESVETELEKQLRLEKLEEKSRNKDAAAYILCFSRTIAKSMLEGTAACGLDHTGEKTIVRSDAQKAIGNKGGSASGEVQMVKESRLDLLGRDLGQERVYAHGGVKDTGYAAVHDYFSAEQEPSAFGDVVEAVEQRVALNITCDLSGVQAHESMLMTDWVLDAVIYTEPTTALESDQLVVGLVGTPAEQELALENNKQLVAGVSRRRQNNADRRKVLKERRQLASTSIVLEQHKALEGGVDSAVKLQDNSVNTLGRLSEVIYASADGGVVEQDQAGMAVCRSSVPGQ